MIYKIYQPQLPLSQFVEFFWMREDDNLSVVQTRLLPMGTMELVINLYEDRIPLFNRQNRTQCGSTNGIRLCGAHSENFVIHDTRKISMVGVHFRPGGGSAFFDLPAGELHNKIVSLDELWKAHADELRDRLIQEPSYKKRFWLMEHFLMQMLRLSDHHPAVDFALQKFQKSANLTIRSIAEQTGFSSRHFNQLFRDQVGVTPKLFCRIQRFQNVLEMLPAKNSVDWTDVAFTCGYFDQAHLIHDFRAFADCTPTEYLTKRGFHPCHIVLPD